VQGTATVQSGVQAAGSGQGNTSKHITLPSLTKRVSKGQKVPLNLSSKKIKVNFGWNVKNSACDVDVSAFLLSGSGKVVGDDYFVFYGQESKEAVAYHSPAAALSSPVLGLCGAKLHRDRGLDQLGHGRLHAKLCRVREARHRVALSNVRE